MDEHIYPERKAVARARSPPAIAGSPPPIVEELKPKARAAGLWNLFLPDKEARRRTDESRVRAAVRDHGPLAHGARGVQLLGARHGQHGSAGPVRHARSSKKQWLKPLLAGEIRSCFAMTEPEVASSDATNIQSSIDRDGDSYVINGRKWWSSGAGDPRCKIAIFMGKTDPNGRTAQPAIDDPGAVRYAGRQGRTDADRVRLRPRAARPRRSDLRERPRAGLEPAVGRRPRLRNRPGPARPGPDSSLHAADRPGRTGIGADVPAASRSGSPSASRSPSRARFAPTSPTRASKSNRPGC